MPRLLRILLTGLAFATFSLFGLLLGYVVFPIYALTVRDPLERARHAQWFLHRCFRFYCRYLYWTGLTGLHRRNARPRLLDGDEPAIVIANHPTLLDIVFIVAEVPRATFLFKANTTSFRSPLLFPMLRDGRHIPAVAAGEGSPVDGAVLLEQIISRLNEGQRVVIFPEGTRSPEGRLGRFYSGAFEAAIRAQVPLVPMLFRVDPPALMKHQRWYHVPSRRIGYDLEYLPTIEPPQFPSNARAFCAKVRSDYEHALGMAKPVREPIAGDREHGDLATRSA